MVGTDYNFWSNFWAVFGVVCVILAAIAGYKHGIYTEKKTEKSFQEASNERVKHGDIVEKRFEKTFEELDLIVKRVDSIAVSMIDELESKSKIALLAIEKLERDSKKASERIGVSMAKIQEDTQRITHDLDYRDAVLRMEFKILNYQEGEDGLFLRRATDFIIKEHNYELNVNGMSYNWMVKDMDGAGEYGLILDSKTDTYFINFENISSGGETAIIVTFRLERLKSSNSSLNSMENNYSSLAFTSRFSPKFDDWRNMSTDSFTQRIEPLKCFLQFRNENTWREFSFDHKVNTGGYFYTGEAMIFKRNSSN